MDIELSIKTIENLTRREREISALRGQFNAIIITCINEKGEEGRNYKLSPDLKMLIEQKED